jgi:penicillin amidase
LGIIAKTRVVLAVMSAILEGSENMKASVWKMSVLILAVAVVASGQTANVNHSGMVAVNDGQSLTTDPVSTTRDSQGIWFIEGGDLYDVFEATGYAVATDRLWQMDIFRRQGRGRLSELLGASMVPTDVFLRTIDYSDDEYAAMFSTLSDDAQTVVTAYTDGVNRRISEFYAGNWMQMPYEYWLLGLSSVLQGPGLPVLPAPWQINDVLATVTLHLRGFDPEGQVGPTGQLDNGILVQTLGAVYPTEYGAMFQDLRWINDPSAQTMIPSGAKSAIDQGLDPVAAQKILAMPDLSDATERLRSRTSTLNRQMVELNARVKMGSYAWAISGDRTASGNPMLYSGPQMGFMTPSIITEGSVRGGGLEISGMTFPGTPGFPIGRTPHHAWSMQVGHAHTLDFYIEAPQSAVLNRMETIQVFGGADVVVPIFRTSHGPIVDPMPFDPGNPPDFAVAWAYAHWGHEVDALDTMLLLARAESIAEFDEGIEIFPVSQHTTYADRDGNIAYWMSGYDPIRAAGVDPRLPSVADGTTEWTGERRPRVHDSNTAQGWYGGWNNKSAVDYNNATNSYSYYLGSAHRAHVVEDYLSTHDDLTFEEVRDLALNIATTDSFGGGGNTWSFVADAFSAAVAADPTADRQAAVDMLQAWDGHFVAGGPAEWRMGLDRADAWVFQDAWIKEVLRLTFEDEFVMAGLDYNDQRTSVNFNVLLRALDPDSAIPIYYDWFQDKSDSGKPTTAEGIIIQALDNVIAEMGLGGYGAARGWITYTHQVFGTMWQTPWSARSTYAQCVEYDSNGLARLETMFPLGESGSVLPDAYGQADIDDNFFSMVPAFDPFMPRPFPLFD